MSLKLNLQHPNTTKADQTRNLTMKLIFPIYGDTGQYSLQIECSARLIFDTGHAVARDVLAVNPGQRIPNAHGLFNNQNPVGHGAYTFSNAM